MAARRIPSRRAKRPKPSVSPGRLFLVGGKDGHNEDRALIDRFARICGGAKARLLVITSASDEPARHQEEYRDAFEKAGVGEVTIFHSDQREATDDPELLGSLDRANGVYFSGGGQLRLLGIMGGTRFEERLRERHREGMHVGGTSAGASAMSSVMIAQGEGRKPLQRSSVELSTGFGLLPGVIIDQHFQQRERFSRLIAAVLLHPAKLGFGLDETTAAEIDAKGHVEVFGAGALTVVDGSRIRGANRKGSAANGDLRPFAGIQLHVLTEGWRFHLATRKARPPA